MNENVEIKIIDTDRLTEISYTPLEPYNGELWEWQMHMSYPDEPLRHSWTTVGAVELGRHVLNALETGLEVVTTMPEETPSWEEQIEIEKRLISEFLASYGQKLYDWPEEETVTCPACGHRWEWDWCGDVISSRDIIGLHGPEYAELEINKPKEFYCQCGELLAVIVMFETEYLGLWLPFEM